MVLDYNRCILLLRANRFDEAKALLLQSPIDLENSEKNCKLLFLCVQKGCTGIIDILLTQGLSIDLQNQMDLEDLACSGKGFTALHYEIQLNSRSSNMVSYLLSKGARHLEDHIGLTPLHYAANSLNFPNIDVLLKHGANIAARDQMGFTPMHYVAYQAKSPTTNVKDLERILSSDVSKTFFTAKNNDGETPFDMVKRPWIGEGKIDERIRRILCFADFALKSGREVDAEELLKRVSELDKTNGPLFIIAEHFNPGLLNKFLNYFSLSVKDKKENEIRNAEKRTLMHFAMQNKNSIAMFRFLHFTLKCSFNTGDKEGIAPIHIAIDREDFSALYWLVGLNAADFSIWDQPVYRKGLWEGQDGELSQMHLKKDSFQASMRVGLALNRFFRKHYQEKGVAWAMKRIDTLPSAKPEFIKILREEITKFLNQRQSNNAQIFLSVLKSLDPSEGLDLALEFLHQFGEFERLTKFSFALIEGAGVKKSLKIKARMVIIESLLCGNFILQDQCYQHLVRLYKKHLPDFNEDNALKYALFSYLRAFQALDLLDACETEDKQLRQRIIGYLTDKFSEASNLSQEDWSSAAIRLWTITKSMETIEITSELTQESIGFNTEEKIEELFESLIPYFQKLTLVDSSLVQISSINSAVVQIAEQTPNGGASSPNISLTI